MILLEFELECEIRRWEQIQNGWYGRKRKAKDQHEKKHLKTFTDGQVGEKINFLNQSINPKTKHNEKDILTNHFAGISNMVFFMRRI